MTRPEIGDLVTTTTGKLYRIRHTTGNGRHMIEPWEGSGHAPGRRNGWARAVTFVKSYELAMVDVHLRLAGMHDSYGDNIRAVKNLDDAARYLVRAHERDVDTAADLTHARVAIEALAARLSTLDV